MPGLKMTGENDGLYLLVTNDDGVQATKLYSKFVTEIILSEHKKKNNNKVNHNSGN